MKFQNVLKSSSNTAPNKLSRTSTSMTRSVTTVPSATCTGTPLVRRSTEQRMTSPMRGSTRLAR